MNIATQTYTININSTQNFMFWNQISSFVNDLFYWDNSVFFTDIASVYFDSVPRGSILLFDFMVAIILAVFIMLQVYNTGWAVLGTNYFLYFGLVVIAAQGLSLSDNLLEFTLCWVVLNVSLYGLMLRGVRSYSAELVTKYFYIGAATTSLVFVSVSLHMAQYGSLDYSRIFYLLNHNLDTSSFLSITQIVTFFCFCIAFLVKLGAFPFHFFVPAMYSSVEYPVLGVITLPVKWYVYLAMLNFFNMYGYTMVYFHSAILVIGLGCLFVGYFGAFSVNRLRHFWAYSYISNLGFVFLSIAQNDLSLNFGVSLIFFATYMLTWLAIYWWFLLVRVRRLTEFSRSGLLVLQNLEMRYISDLVNIKVPAARLTLGVLLFSLMGMPPTAGFFAKFLVLAGLMEGLNYGFFSLFILVSVLFLMPLGAYNYLRLIRNMCFVGNDKKVEHSAADLSVCNSMASDVTCRYGSREVVIGLVIFVVFFICPIFVFFLFLGMDLTDGLSWFTLQNHDPILATDPVRYHRSFYGHQFYSETLDFNRSGRCGIGSDFTRRAKFLGYRIPYSSSALVTLGETCTTRSLPTCFTYLSTFNYNNLK